MRPPSREALRRDPAGAVAKAGDAGGAVRGAGCAVVALAALALPLHSQQPPPFRSSVQTVTVYATVQSRDGRLVADLTRDDFEVSDDGRPAPITVFSSDPQPITLAVLLDMSGSMERHFLRVREATRHLIAALGTGDRARIGTFGEEVALSPHLTGDQRILQRVLAEELWPGGRTPLGEAVVAAMRSLQHESGRRVVLTVTDGFDSDDGPVGAARRRAERDAFLLYAIGLEGSSLEGELVDLTKRTGGGHFLLERNAELTAAM